MIYFFISINIAALVLGQTLWKMGLKNKEVSLTPQGVLSLIKNPYIIAGIIVYSFATIIWLYILSKSELSLVYPLQSLCYVAAAFAAIIFLKETIPLTRWIGIGFIIIGAFFVALG